MPVNWVKSAGFGIAPEGVATKPALLTSRYLPTAENPNGLATPLVAKACDGPAPPP